VVSSDNYELTNKDADEEEDDDKDEDVEKDKDDINVKPIVTQTRYVLSEVSGEIAKGRVVHDDDVNDFIANCFYHALQAQALDQHYEMPTELTEEEALQVIVILIEDVEKRRYVGPDHHAASSPATATPMRSF
jgi:hypothetical protein